MEILIVEKIISGGQSGADLSGLDVGLYLNLKTGGTMPKGYRTENGNKPEYAEKYGVVEDYNTSYVPRTELNVLNSDATLIFGKNSGGSKLTRSFCKQHHKPSYHHYWDANTPVTLYSIEAFRKFIIDNNVKVLNVAGNREEKNKGIYNACRDFLIDTLVIRHE